MHRTQVSLTGEDSWEHEHGRVSVPETITSSTQGERRRERNIKKTFSHHEPAGEDGDHDSVLVVSQSARSRKWHRKWSADFSLTLLLTLFVRAPNFRNSWLRTTVYSATRWMSCENLLTLYNTTESCNYVQFHLHTGKNNNVRRAGEGSCPPPAGLNTTRRLI